MLTHFAPVAAAIFLAHACEAEGEGEAGQADVRAALASFETWYAETHEKPFWALFEHYIPETPLVDF